MVCAGACTIQEEGASAYINGKQETCLTAVLQLLACFSAQSIKNVEVFQR